MNESQLIQKVLKEGEAVVKRQDRLVSAVDKVLKESGKIMTTLDKVKLAKVIDNVSNLLLLNEAEGTQISDIAKKSEFLNLVVTTYAKSTLPTATMTFAQDQETSIVYYLAYKYDTKKGEIVKGDVLNSVNKYWVAASKVEAASKFASSEIALETIGAVLALGTYRFEFTPIIPGTIKITDGTDKYTDDGEGNVSDGTTTGTIDYNTGIFTSVDIVLADATVDYEYDNQTSPVKVPQLKLEVSKLTLNAKAYTLGFNYSTFAAYNLLRSQNVDLKDLLGEGTANELVAEKDALVYNDFENSGTTLSVTHSATASAYYSERDQIQSFGLRLIEAQQLVFNKTRKIRPNIVVCGTNGSYLARQLEGFNETGVSGSTGITVFGTWKGLTFIENPFQDSDVCVLTWKSGDFSSSYAVGDYMPVIQTQMLAYEDFSNKSSLATVFSKKMLNPDFFAEVLITH